jgi:hypothetical protein
VNVPARQLNVALIEPFGRGRESAASKKRKKTKTERKPRLDRKPKKKRRK